MMTPYTPDWQALGKRLDRLERENRRLKGAGPLVLVGLAAVALMGQALPPSPKIEAHEFVLRDPSGMVRASLRAQPDGAVTLSLNDGDGKPRVALGIEQDGRAGLDVHDRQGGPREVLGVEPDGSPALSLYEGDGSQRAAFRLGGDGRPGLNLFDKDGKIIWGSHLAAPSPGAR